MAEPITIPLSKMMRQSAPPEYRSYPMGAIHDFYLFDEISEPSNYVDLITCLNTASEGEIVNIYINTSGGNLSTTISIIHAIMRSDATVITHADGEVSSAGTMIFLSGHTLMVYPYSNFMFHDANMGMMGKLSESMKSIVASTELIKRMALDIYVPYFTIDEVENILAGMDYYCDSEEMIQRIECANEVSKDDQD